MNDFDKSLKDKHTYKSYKAHFAPVYRGAQFFKMILLGISCAFSMYFFAGYFGMFGEASIYIGFATSVLLSIIIGITTGKVLLYWSYQKTLEPLLTAVLVLCIGLNIYADFNGAQVLGEELSGLAPTDTKTSEINGIYSPQIASIDKEIDELESKHFYWCATHKKAHKCDVANFYIDPKKDRAIVAKIDGLKKRKANLVDTMSGMIAENHETHTVALNTHSEKVENNKNRMRFGSVVCTIFYILFSMWAHNYGLRAITETNETQTVTQRNPQAPRNAMRNTQGGSVTIQEEINEHWQAQEDDFDDLREELNAMREAEKKR